MHRVFYQMKMRRIELIESIRIDQILHIWRKRKKYFRACRFESELLK